jgi:hypothetical protein
VLGSNHPWRLLYQDGAMNQRMNLPRQRMRYWWLVLGNVNSETGIVTTRTYQPNSPQLSVL